jgi:hypothetical protein
VMPLRCSLLLLTCRLASWLARGLAPLENLPAPALP